jgi:ABC-type nickel/cobalt efflux system permease component RcnA
MLVAEIRRRLRLAGAATAADADHRHDHLGPVATHEHAHDLAHDHDLEHHDHELEHGDHSHGGIRHAHLPPIGSTLSWRALFSLGLAGGLIPSTSALLILLGSMAAGRAAFGLVLVVAFGLGMAAVMSSVGLAMIMARGRLDRLPRRSALGRLAGYAPLVASVTVLTVGLMLTWQAIWGRPVL